MELKTYQKNVIADLVRFLELVNEKRYASKAYSALWTEKNVVVDGGVNGMPFYHTQLQERPKFALRCLLAVARHSLLPVLSSRFLIPCRCPVQRLWFGWFLQMPF